MKSAVVWSLIACCGVPLAIAALGASAFGLADGGREASVVCLTALGGLIAYAGSRYYGRLEEPDDSEEELRWESEER